MEALSIFYRESSEMLAYMDINRRILSPNLAWTSQLGWVCEALEGKLVENFVHAEDMANTVELLEDLANEMKDGIKIEFECRFLHKNTSWRILRWRLVPDVDSGYYACFVQDITASRERSNHSGPSVDFIKTIVDHLPVAVFCKDSKRDFELVVWNKVCEQWWGISEEQALGKNDYNFFPEEQANLYRASDTKVLTDGVLVDIPNEPTFHMVKGTINCHTLKVPVPDVDGTNRYLLGISEDITEKKQMQSELDDRRIQVVASARLATLGEMAGGIAHEINSPLGVILMRSRHILGALKKDPCPIKDIAKMAEAIETTAVQIDKIVGGLRTFARSGDRDPFESGSLRSVIDSTLSLCQQQFENHNINLQCQGVIDEIMIECRLVQISQILLNLLSNAKYAVKEMPSERWVKIICEDLNDKIRISVVDSGAGIPQENRARILDPFFTTKQVGEGTGLGLSISKGIADDHGGKLYLDESQLNTTFVLELPKKQVNRN